MRVNRRGWQTARVRVEELVKMAKSLDPDRLRKRIAATHVEPEDHERRSDGRRRVGLPVGPGVLACAVKRDLDRGSGADQK